MKKLLPIIIFFFALIPLQAQNSNELFNRGEEAFEAGDSDAAVEWFKKSVEANPKNWQAHFGIGYVFFLSERYEESVPYLEKALQYSKKKENMGVYALLSMSYYLTENTDAALATLEKGIKNYPKFVELYWIRANIYIDMEYYVSAMKDCDKMLELNPSNTDAMLIKSNLLSVRGKYEEALQLAVEAAKISYSAEAYLTAADLEYKLGQYEDAIYHLSRSLTEGAVSDQTLAVLEALADTVPEQLLAKLDAQAVKYPTHPIWPSASCYACTYLYQWHRAIPYAEAVFNLSGDSTSLERLIDVEVSAGEYDKSIQHCEQLMEWGLPYDNFLCRKIMGLANDGRPDEAIQVYESTISRQSGDTIILLQPTADSVIRHTMIDSIGGVSALRTLIYSRKGEWAKALEFVEQDWPHAVDAADSSGIYSFKMMMYLQLGDTLSAQDAARKAIALKPDRILAYYVLGDQETANRYLMEKYDLNSENAEDLFYLAEAYADMHDPDNALKYLRKSFELGYFYGRRWIQNDYELSILFDLPEFKALIEEYTEKQKQ
ncbi:MAG: tetratricopeptide repeat protein [Bacteroidales bacterium]|nr:tetratricopeptide repeat protein [Bacteroidales bacterium]